MEAPAVLCPTGKHSETAISILTHNTEEINSTYSGLYMGSQYTNLPPITRYSAPNFKRSKKMSLRW